MREYRVWQKEEENALRLGVAKHGAGNWEIIRTDPQFNAQLYAHYIGVSIRASAAVLCVMVHVGSSTD